MPPESRLVTRAPRRSRCSPHLVHALPGRQRFLHALLPLAVLAAAPAAADQNEEATPPPEAGWAGQANLNLASSYGNAGSGSLGLSAQAARETERLRIAFDGGLLRTSTGTVTRFAVGAPDAFSVQRTVTRQISADRSHLRARLSEPSPESGETRLRFFAAAGWERDAPAGVEVRYDFTLGVETAWGGAGDGGRRPVEVGAGLSAVHQSDEVADPEVGAASVGLRLDARAERRYHSADLALVSVSTWNLANTDDLRLDVTASVGFPLSKRLAFRTSIQTLFDSRPSLERLNLLAAPGGVPVGAVAAPRRRTDLIVLAALAVRF